jgi:formyltetrahydrofolate synthetase
MSKTQFSLTDDANYIGDPTGRPLTVTDVRYAGGPGWIVALCGRVFEMPGMSWNTAGARELELSRDDDTFGGHVVKNLD